VVCWVPQQQHPVKEAAHIARTAKIANLRILCLFNINGTLFPTVACSEARRWFDAKLYTTRRVVQMKPWIFFNARVIFFTARV
jgi:hypothetical protein